MQRIINVSPITLHTHTHTHTFILRNVYVDGGGNQSAGWRRDDAMGMVSAYGGGRERHCRTRFVFGQRLLYSCTIKIVRPRGRAPDGNSRPFTPFHSLDTAPCVHTYLTTYPYLSNCLLARPPVTIYASARKTLLFLVAHNDMMAAYTHICTLVHIIV